MIINHNIPALNTTRQLSINGINTQKSLEKLSSGLRINRAGDDAAGLAISEKMRGQIRGLNQASRNAQDGISMIQTAEGALNETHSILQRMRELAVQASTDSNTASDRGEMQKEIDQLATEITRISTDTEFNTKKLLNGTMGKTYTSTNTANGLQANNIQIVGTDITNGSYTLTLTNAATDAFTFTSNSAAATIAADVDLGVGSKYGDYQLHVTNFNNGTSTADFELIGPDGASSGIVSAASNDSLTIAGVTIDFTTRAVTINGDVNFTAALNNVKADLSGAKTVTSTAFNYTGGNVNIGGFQFELRAVANRAALDATTFQVTDSGVKFQIGANASQNTSLSINNMSAAALSVNALNVTTQTGANTAITTIDAAITSVSAERSKLGAMQNRLEHTINNLGTTSENLSASESRVRDVDMAKEMMEFTKNNILSQAAQAMLAQANQQPQGVLQLLR